MRIPTRTHNYRKPHEGGVPIDVAGKRLLRNRSMSLTNAQRHVLRQIGVRADKITTEKQAVMLVKRICGPETNYRHNPEGSLLFRKRKTSKPKRISKRQHYINVTMYRADSGSKSAAKHLANL